MKVLVLSHMYPSTANEVAGIFIYEQVKALAKLGIQVRVVSPVPWTPCPVSLLKSKWRALAQVPPEADYEGVHVYYPRYLALPRAQLFAGSGRRMYQGIEQMVKRIYREFRFDLIHAHEALPDGYAGALLSQNFGKPLVITIHGQDLQQTIHRDSNCKEAVAFALQHASRIILVSRKLRHLAVEHLGIADKLVVIPTVSILKKS